MTSQRKKRRAANAKRRRLDGIEHVPREHVNADGKPKRMMRSGNAKSLAERTGMNYYRCSYCGTYHVGRTAAQVDDDAGRRRRR